jgi:hypothetical protein
MLIIKNKSPFPKPEFLTHTSKSERLNIRFFEQPSFSGILKGVFKGLANKILIFVKIINLSQLCYFMKKTHGVKCFFRTFRPTTHLQDVRQYSYACL